MPMLLLLLISRVCKLSDTKEVVFVLKQNRRKKSKGKQKKGEFVEEGRDLSDAGNESALGADMIKLHLGNVQKSPGSDPRSRASDVANVPAGKDHLSSRYPSWKRISSSESEYSDAEGGIQSKVR